MFFNMEASQVCRNINFSHDGSLSESPIFIALTVLLIAIPKILLKIDRDLVISDFCKYDTNYCHRASQAENLAIAPQLRN